MQDKHIAKDIEIEVYTERLNDMIAKYVDFMPKHPDNPLDSELHRMWSILSVAHRKSRIYVEDDFLKQWESLLKDADDLLVKAEAQDVLKKLRH